MLGSGLIEIKGGVSEWFNFARSAQRCQVAPAGADEGGCSLCGGSYGRSGLNFARKIGAVCQ